MLYCFGHIETVRNVYGSYLFGERYGKCLLGYLFAGGARYNLKVFRNYEDSGELIE